MHSKITDLVSDRLLSPEVNKEKLDASFIIRIKVWNEMQYATGWQWFLIVMNKVLHLSDQNLYRYTKKQKQYEDFGRDH